MVSDSLLGTEIVKCLNFGGNQREKDRVKICYSCDLFIFATFGIFGREKRKLACREVSAKSDFHAKHHVVVCPGYCPLLLKYNKGPVRGLVIANYHLTLWHQEELLVNFISKRASL